LVHHFIENWSNVFLSKLWVCHTNNCLEVLSIENCFLKFNITEFLIFNVDLTIWFFITCSNSNIISVEMACKRSWSKSDFSFLFGFLWGGWSCIIIWEFFWTTNISVFIKNPSVSRTCIEESSDLLWWISNENFRHISIIF